MRLGDGDLGDRDRLTERERVGDRGVTERRGDTECAERGRVSDLVRDLSREGLRVRERAGDGERDGMVFASYSASMPSQGNGGRTRSRIASIHERISTKSMFYVPCRQANRCGESPSNTRLVDSDKIYIKGDIEQS